MKTYAHTLMLLREKLEDQGDKKEQLERAVAAKKVELMTAMRDQLAKMGRLDASLDAQIAALREKAGLDQADKNETTNAKRSPALAVMR